MQFDSSLFSSKQDQLQNKYCPTCNSLGLTSKLWLFKINFSEAIYLCTSKQCLFPFQEKDITQFLMKYDSGLTSTQLLQNNNDFPNSNQESVLLDVFGNLESSDKSYSEKDFVDCAVFSNTLNTSIDFSKTAEKFLTDEDSVIASFKIDSGENLSLANNSSFCNLSEEKESCQNDSLRKTVINLNDRSVSNCASSFSPNKLNIFTRKNKGQVLQWKNKSNLCWLDVLLHCFVNSIMLRASFMANSKFSNANRVLYKFCLTYDDLQNKYSDVREIIEASSSKTKSLLDLICDTIEEPKEIIYELMKANYYLQTGQNESVVEMFPNLLKLDKDAEAAFLTTYRSEFECKQCQYKSLYRATSPCISFLSVPSHFHPHNASYSKRCFKCRAANQTVYLTLEKVSPCVAMHFQSGLSHNNFQMLDFGLQGHLFSVFAVIQYITAPYKHFVAWMRNTKTNEWLCCDGLNNLECKWTSKVPNFPHDQIHVIMWEKQSLTPNTPVSEFESHLSPLYNNIPLKFEPYPERDSEDEIILDDDDDDDNHNPNPDTDDKDNDSHHADERDEDVGDHNTNSNEDAHHDNPHTDDNDDDDNDDDNDDRNPNPDTDDKDNDSHHTDERDENVGDHNSNEDAHHDNPHTDDNDDDDDDNDDRNPNPDTDDKDNDSHHTDERDEDVGDHNSNEDAHHDNPHTEDNDDDDDNDDNNPNPDTDDKDNDSHHTDERDEDVGDHNSNEDAHHDNPHTDDNDDDDDDNDDRNPNPDTDDKDNDSHHTDERDEDVGDHNSNEDAHHDNPHIEDNDDDDDNDDNNPNPDTDDKDNDSHHADERDEDVGDHNSNEDAHHDNPHTDDNDDDDDDNDDNNPNPDTDDKDNDSYHADERDEDVGDHNTNSSEDAHHDNPHTDDSDTNSDDRESRDNQVSLVELSVVISPLHFVDPSVAQTYKIKEPLPTFGDGNRFTRFNVVPMTIAEPSISIDGHVIGKSLDPNLDEAVDELLESDRLLDSSHTDSEEFSDDQDQEWLPPSRKRRRVLDLKPRDFKLPSSHVVHFLHLPQKRKPVNKNFIDGDSKFESFKFNKDSSRLIQAAPSSDGVKSSLLRRKLSFSDWLTKEEVDSGCGDCASVTSSIATDAQLLLTPFRASAAPSDSVCPPEPLTSVAMVSDGSASLDNDLLQASFNVDGWLDDVMSNSSRDFLKRSENVVTSTPPRLNAASIAALFDLIS